MALMIRDKGEQGRSGIHTHSIFIEEVFNTYYANYSIDVSRASRKIATMQT